MSRILAIISGFQTIVSRIVPVVGRMFSAILGTTITKLRRPIPILRRIVAIARSLIADAVLLSHQASRAAERTPPRPAPRRRRQHLSEC